MQIIDSKIRKHFLNYFFQCLLATLAILMVLTFLNVLTETAIIVSLGATAFTVFARPQSYFAQPRRLMGGYLVGIIVGCFFYFLSYLLKPYFTLTPRLSDIIFGAISVGSAIFIMTVTDTEHAPAAGIALGLVINKWNYLTLIFIFSAVLLFYFVKKLLEPFLIDLV